MFGFIGDVLASLFRREISLATGELRPTLSTFSGGFGARANRIQDNIPPTDAGISHLGFGRSNPFTRFWGSSVLLCPTCKAVSTLSEENTVQVLAKNRKFNQNLNLNLKIISMLWISYLNLIILTHINTVNNYIYKFIYLLIYL